MKLSALIVGIIAIAVNVTIYWQTERKKLLLTKLIADSLWGVQYALLGGYTGAAIALIGVLRSIVFLNEDKKWASGKKWLIIFLLLSIASAFFTYKGTESLLPVLASLLAVLSFWQKKPSLTRFLSFPIATAMLIYDIFIGSAMGLINETMVLVSSFMAVIKLKDRNKGVNKR